MTEAPEGKVVEIEPRFRLIPFDRVTIGSERVYLVKGLIPRTGLIVAWGPPKCGKSFWTFDLVARSARLAIPRAASAARPGCLSRP